MREKLKGLNPVRKWLALEGRWETYWYPWKKRKGVPKPPRLPGKYRSPEFDTAYYKAWADRKEKETHDTARAVNTLGFLIEEKFLKSQHYAKLDPDTKGQYDWIVPSILSQFGDLELEALKDRRTRAIFIEWRDSIAAGTCKTLVSRRPENRPRIASTSMADIHLQKLAAILNWAFKAGWIDAHPLKEVEPLHQRGSRLDKIWSWEQEATLLTEGRRDLVEAYLVDVWVGARGGDLISFWWSDFDGDFLRYEAEKRPRPGARRKRLMTPVGGPLKLVLSAMEKRAGLEGVPLSDIRRQRPIILNSLGRPWKNEHSLYGAFHNECVRLGIEDRTLHDVRRTAVTRLAIAGCTEPEIVSITGHSPKEVAAILYRHYLYLDPQIAINAIRKLENGTFQFYAAFVRHFLEGPNGERGVQPNAQPPLAVLNPFSEKGRKPAPFSVQG